jgi:hypothetical protein
MVLKLFVFYKQSVQIPSLLVLQRGAVLIKWYKGLISLTLLGHYLFSVDI